MIKNNPGFSLIELVIVIIIITTLYLFFAIDPTNYLQKSRDQQRISNLKDFAAFLERETLSGNITLLPTKSEITSQEISFQNSLSSLSISGDGYIPLIVDFEFPNNISQLPSDPRNNQKASSTEVFRYLYCSDGKSFKLATLLESRDSQKLLANDGGESDLWYEVGSDLTLCEF